MIQKAVKYCSREHQRRHQICGHTNPGSDKTVAAGNLSRNRQWRDMIEKAAVLVVKDDY